MSEYMDKRYEYISKINDHVWIGSVPPRDEPLYQKFDVLVLAAKENQLPSNYWDNIEIVYAPLDDSGNRITNQEKNIATSTALFIARRLKQGKRVLFTCTKGLNRSTFIAALSMLYAGMEFNPDIVINKMRRARGLNAFTNKDFELIYRQEAYMMINELGLDY